MDAIEVYLQGNKRRLKRKQRRNRFDEIAIVDRFRNMNLEAGLQRSPLFFFAGISGESTGQDPAAALHGQLANLFDQLVAIHAWHADIAQ